MFRVTLVMMLKLFLEARADVSELLDIHYHTHPAGVEEKFVENENSRNQRGNHR